MADKRIRDCLERVGDAERALTQLRVVEQQLVATREILELLQNDPEFRPAAAKASSGFVLGQNIVDIDVSTPQAKTEALDSNQVTLREIEPTSSMVTKQGGDVQLLTEELEVTQDQLAKEKDLVGIAPETAARLGLSVDEVMKAFRCFSHADKDDSGKINTKEMRNLLEQTTGAAVPQCDADRILLQHDKNDDGSLDFEEFLFCYCSLPSKKRQHLQSALNSSATSTATRLDLKFRTRIVGVVVDDLTDYLKKELKEESGFLQIPVISALFFFFVLSTILHHNTALSNSLENGVRFDIQENANFAFVGAAPFENGRMGHKSISDVNSFEDFWSWLDIGLAPLFFPSGWGVSEPRSNVAARCSSPLDAMAGAGWKSTNASKANTPYGNGAYAAVTGDLGLNLCGWDEETKFPKALSDLKAFGDDTKKPYLYFNEIIAGMRMRQEMLPLRECNHPESFGHTSATPCFDVNEAWLAPDLDTALHINEDRLNQPGGETVYFQSGMDMADVHRHIRGLENRRWVNPRTAKIELTYPLHNNQMDAFIAVYVNFFITRGGHIHKVIKPIVIWMYPYQNPASYVVDVIFALLVFKLFAEEALQIVLNMREHGVGKGLSDYFSNFANIIDWSSLAYSAVIFVMWAQWCFKCVELQDIMLTADTKVAGGWPGGSLHTAGNAEFWDIVDSISRYGQTFQVVLAYYPFVIGARFFSAFSAQPRLGLVTATLVAAGNDLLHFGVVLGTTIMIFCSSAVLLFGREVNEFENFGRTYVSVFRGLMGDLDYEPLTEIGRAPALLWFAAFMVFVNMVMVNMLLAIIMDVYGSVKGQIGDNVEDFPTMFSQTCEIVRRAIQKRRGQRMSLQSILHELEQRQDECYTTQPTTESAPASARHLGLLKLGASGTFKPPREPKHLAVSTFMRLVQGLSPAQAERLLSHAMEAKDAELSKEGSVSDCLDRLREVDLRVQHVQFVNESTEASNDMLVSMAATIERFDTTMVKELDKIQRMITDISVKGT